MVAERGLARSRAGAAEAIRAGRVRLGADGPLVDKPSELIDPGADLTVAEGRQYVSRGGTKLANALDALGVDPAGRDCLDTGASTGGFTDCLLQRGARRVVALDVARGQLDWSLRNDDRVAVLEGINARSIAAADLPWVPSLVTADLAFISLAKVVPALAEVLEPDGELLAMVKPQFELGKGRARGGVVRDPADRREALLLAADACAAAGLGVRGFASSGLPGPKGNRETFVWAIAGVDGVDVQAAVEEVEP